MEKKINIAELLKDCSKGTKLYSPLCGECKLYDITDYSIKIETFDKDTLIDLFHDGTFCSNGECMLYPSKDKTTWEGFIQPFKDGDVIYTCINCSTINTKSVSIFKECSSDGKYTTYASYCINSNSFYSYHTTNTYFCNVDDITEQRLATDAEKDWLFAAMKNSGYKWNSETKTLEKMIKPKFKVGDRIRHKENPKWVCVIRRINDRYWVDNHPTCYTLLFDMQDEYELVPNKFDITTLKPFDKVLVRLDNSYWRIQFFERINKKNKNYPFVCMNGYNYKRCIPYEGNEHLLGTANDCDEYFKNW